MQHSKVRSHPRWIRRLAASSTPDVRMQRRSVRGMCRSTGKCRMDTGLHVSTAYSRCLFRYCRGVKRRPTGSGSNRADAGIHLNADFEKCTEKCTEKRNKSVTKIAEKCNNWCIRPQSGASSLKETNPFGIMKIR